MKEIFLNGVGVVPEDVTKALDGLRMAGRDFDFECARAGLTNNQKIQLLAMLYSQEEQLNRQILKEAAQHDLRQ